MHQCGALDAERGDLTRVDDIGDDQASQAHRHGARLAPQFAMNDLANCDTAAIRARHAFASNEFVVGRERVRKPERARQLLGQSSMR